MTEPVISAEFLAPVVARLDRIEAALALVVETATRLSNDSTNLERDVEELQAELREVKACVLGRS